MENISSTAELTEAIRILEIEQYGRLQIMREKFELTVESLRPVNIIGSTLKGMVSSPNLINNILGVSVGLFTGYLSRKAIFAGVANNKYGRIFGNVLQYGVASVVARGPKVINSFKQFIARRIYRLRERNNSKQ